MTGLKMVEFQTRLCEVKGELGYFHLWEQWSNVVDASLLRGGHPAGQIGQVYGIVEFKDGVLPAIRGMRNPKNSWAKSDSGPECPYGKEKCCGERQQNFCIGPNDKQLMMTLRNAGTDHRKFMRMITVYLDITAPLYWWKEFDTYKVGTVANSCSTMHKIAAKEFTLDDFSHEHLVDDLDVRIEIGGTDHRDTGPMEVLGMTIDVLNHYREKYLAATKTEEYTGLPAKDIWWQMIQLLPSSYNQKRTVMLNYEVLANIYKSRRHHKLDEWHTLCDRIESLPYSALITGTAV